MKITKKTLKNQSKVVKSSFTGRNITKYSELNTVAKHMNRQHIVKSLSSSFPTEWHNATKFGVNQVLMVITMAWIEQVKGHTMAVKRICIQHLGDDASEERKVQKAGTPEFYRLVYFGACKDKQERASDRIENV